MRSHISKIAATIWVIIILIFPAVVRAENFSQTDEVEYIYREDLTTQVVQKTILENQVTNLFISEYVLTIPQDILGVPQVYDSLGQMQSTVEKKDSLTYIRAVPNQKVVGKGAKSEYTLIYYLNGLVNTQGRVKEIYIPPLTQENTSITRQVRIQIPKSYGPFAYSKPQVALSESSSFYELELSGTSRQPIIIGFGDYAHYRFNLTYEIVNSTFIPRVLELALPPDTPYQRVYYQEISPQPHNITIDPDGNWIAQFTLNPGQDLTVTASGSAQIFASPQEDFSDLPPAPEHLLSRKFWEVNSPQVQQSAKSLDDSLAIYNFVVNFLSYNYNRLKETPSTTVTRKGAHASLVNPSDAICVEFTDTFIALARAKNIYSRMVTGFAYTNDQSIRPLSQNQDILHAWPEYWDGEKKIWRSTDPTWGDTTGGADYFQSFDFNHFAFTRRGFSSTYPYEAGSVRKSSAGKLIDVTLAQDDFQPPVKNLEFAPLTATVYAGETKIIYLEVKNNSGIARYNTPLQISADNYSQVSAEKIRALPPYSSTKHPLRLEVNPDTPPRAYEKKIIIDDTEKLLTIKVKPEIYKFLPRIPVLLLILLMLFIIIRLYVKSRKNTVSP